MMITEYYLSHKLVNEVNQFRSTYLVLKTFLGCRQSSYNGHKKIGWETKNVGWNY